MQEQINILIKQVADLTQKVASLENALSYSGMPFELRETIRNEVIKGEDTVIGIAQSYTVVLNQIRGPALFTGALVLRNKSGEYVIPYLQRR
jgi:hypothetical protein